jgi:hypothetical protein
MGQERLTLGQIQSIVDKISFMDRTFRVIEKQDGYLLQMQYMEPDVEKPGSEPVLQGTRKWYISPFMTESEIVETCWACACRSMLHVASENFTYKGRRIYSQHFHVDARLEACDAGWFDVRKAP